LIPYLNPEFIAAILGDKSAIASDMRTAPKSAVENSVPVHRSQSAFNEKPVPAPFQWKCIFGRDSLSSVSSCGQTDGTLACIEDLGR
jgi:hypothetical protein